jgi:hypothetical protein
MELVLGAGCPTGLAEQLQRLKGGRPLIEELITVVHALACEAECSLWLVKTHGGQQAVLKSYQRSPLHAKRRLQVRPGPATDPGGAQRNAHPPLPLCTSVTRAREEASSPQHGLASTLHTPRDPVHAVRALHAHREQAAAHATVRTASRAPPVPCGTQQHTTPPAARAPARPHRAAPDRFSSHSTQTYPTPPHPAPSWSSRSSCTAASPRPRPTSSSSGPPGTTRLRPTS